MKSAWFSWLSIIVIVILVSPVPAYASCTKVAKFSEKPSHNVYLYQMLPYNNKLYIAAHDITNSLGKVYTYDGTLKTPFSVPDKILSLAVYNGKLYVGSVGKIFVFDGTSWSTAFSSSNFKEIYSLAVYSNKLYAGTYISAGGVNAAQVYVFDGSSWKRQVTLVDQSPVYALATFKGKLYAGTGGSAGKGKIYYYDGNQFNIWKPVSRTFSGRIINFKEFNNKLYAITAFVPGGMLYYTTDGNSWTGYGIGANGYGVGIEGYNTPLGPRIVIGADMMQLYLCDDSKGSCSAVLCTGGGDGRISALAWYTRNGINRLYFAVSSGFLDSTLNYYTYTNP